MFKTIKIPKIMTGSKFTGKKKDIEAGNEKFNNLNGLGRLENNHLLVYESNLA
jgi:hypothetical protein